MSSLHDFALDESAYVELLRKLISVSEHVQNAPGLGLIPQENLVSDFVLEELKPFTGAELSVERVEFVAGRGNVIIKYAPPSAAADKTLALLYGRGTTDCLGHVALLTLLFKELAKHKVQTKTQVVCVLIASEENSEIEGAMDAMTKIQEYFYKEFGPVDKEKEYNYSCPSTMKPTRIESSVNGLNQIPPWAKIAGDVRLSPFYEMKEMIAKMTAFVDGLNANITSLEGHRGPVSNYYEGIACSLDSAGYKALNSAIEDVLGEAKPFSISGSLPLVRDMQRGGFDLTLVGFGKSSVYHGDNEYCQLSDMKDALKILALTIANVDAALKQI
ncbi:hypothetical protein PF004_g613 [Phytophthora fragariae]|uniref:Peptidase M20 dimerisation domain-containing protein n=1 Tax=Phytophthora fragariae TaxID=53985 RepID=A0A6G0PV05_9STRA|nr:hypothetical protein PF004_g613 [Phytophthora fragariae]